MRVFIDPMSHHFLDDRLFSGHTFAPIHRQVRDLLREHHLEVRTIDHLPERIDDDKKICISFGRLRRFEALERRRDLTLSAYFAFEIPIVDPDLYRRLPTAESSFRRIFTWAESPALLPFAGKAVNSKPFRLPVPLEGVIEELWSRRKRDGLVMINSNKQGRLRQGELYRERMRAVYRLSQLQKVDLYGREWHLPPYRLGLEKVPYSVRQGWRLATHLWHKIAPDSHLEACRRAWLGPIRDKYEVLARYRYCLCYENMVLQGCVTEKLFDCLFVGTVPIYLGAPEIEEIVPRECFIDRREFDSEADLAAFLDRLSEADLHRYRKAGRDFLESARFEPFSRRTFARRVLKIALEDLGLPDSDEEA